MKSHKSYGKQFIGVSDKAVLSLFGCVSGTDITEARLLQFGEDGAYYAYICDEEAIIPEHYRRMNTFTDHLVIVDDSANTQRYEAHEIVVYRAGNFGCIIQMLKDVIR